MNDLAIAMYAGISSTRAMHPERVICYFLQGPLENILDSANVQVGLRLPAIKLTPMVLNLTGYSSPRRNKFGGKKLLPVFSQCGPAMCVPRP